MFLEEILGTGSPLAPQLPEGLRLPELCVCLQPLRELTWHVGSLHYQTTTSGFEVVWWQNVEPVGGMLGGYFDLYNGSLGGGTYSLGIML